MTQTTLQFLGAASTVTGSKFLLTVGGRRLLIDAGMFQGEKRLRVLNWEPFRVEPATLTDLILTHAHLDHVGYLPALVKAGFDGPIWCTEGTRRLAEIVLRDAAKLQEQEAEDANERGYSKHTPALPLYTTDDVEACLPLFTPLEYDTDFDLRDDITIRLTRAGHILGSASVNVWTPTASVLFSGDLGRHDHAVLKPRGTPPGATFALIESTYGDREHPEPENLPHEGFADIIRRTIERGGSVLVPAFAVDRTEVVLKTLSELRRSGRIPAVPVYVNSPMANAALDVYLTLTDELRDDLHPEDFLRFPDLHDIRTPEESKALTAPGGHGPSIIIASSGMATGGRVLHHLETMLPDPRNAVVLTGYQGVGTRGRSLVEGEKQIKMRGRYIPVAAEIFQDREFSVHADCSDLLDWVRELDPKPATIFCVHGEPDAAAALGRRLSEEFGVQAVVPTLGEVVVLDGPGRAAGQEALPAPRVADRAGVGRAGAATSPERPAATAPASRSAVAASTSVSASVLPAGSLRYRCLTGPDDAEFCRRVSAALDEGYVLHGSPALAWGASGAYLAQAVIWPGAVAASSASASAAMPSEPADGRDPDGTTRVDREPTGQED